MLPLRWLFPSMLWSLLWMSALVARADASPALQPERLIEERYQAFQAHIQNGTLHDQLSQEQLLALVDQELSGVVAFPRIARKVMGKYFRSASEEQATRFTEVFKKTLIRTYSKGLSNLHLLERVEIKPAEFGKKGDLARVGTLVVLKSGETYDVTYSLFLNEQQRWQIENIIVEGLNMGLVFRNQFAHLMETEGALEGAVAAWGAASLPQDSGSTQDAAKPE